ncbi:MAG: ABC transporter substrate-binding protein [Promethearchaeota archaeon]
MRHSLPNTVKIAPYHLIQLICLFLLFNVFIFHNSLCYLFVVKERSPQVNQEYKNTLFSTSEAPKVLTVGCWNYLDQPINYDPLKSKFKDISFNQWRRHSLIFDTLVDYNSETKEIIPSLATQWVVSIDSTYWVFTLREDVFFHDGSRFNASSVKFSFERTLNQSNSNDFDFESIEIKSEYEVIFHFKESNAPFIYNQAATHYIVSETSFENSTLTRPIGTGPYKLEVSSSSRTFQNFTRNSNYFKGLPPFERIHYLIYDYFEDLEYAIITKQVDFIPAYLNHMPELIQNDPDYWTLFTSKKTSTVLFGWINHSHPILSDPIVRNALNYAINRPTLIKARRGYATETKTILPPNSPFYNPEIPGYPYNVVKATLLLSMADYPIQSDGYRFHLTIGGIDAGTGRLKQIKSDFEAVGVQTNIIEYEDLSQALLGWISGEVDIHILGGSNDLYPQVEYQLLHSSGDQNYGGYKSNVVDNLLELGQETPVLQERLYYYNLLQELIQYDAPYLLLINLDTFLVYSKKISPYVNLLNEKFVFTYTHQSDMLTKLRIEENFQASPQIINYYEMKNVEIPNIPIYFPFTDIVVYPTDDLIITMNTSMSHNLETFLPDQNEIGKFLQITCSSETTPYRLRCYYNPWEVENIPLDQLIISQYDEQSKTWHKIEPLRQNSTLQYVEVKIQGEKVLIRFNLDIIELTFKFVPIFLFPLGGLVGLATVTIIYNIKKIQDVRKMCEL